ncbi:MAG: hypothetical protein KDJ65_17920 [Anaerolineae bacterium]|nr:hypothetical protein [Anaerolineae bacterium]
MVAKIWQVEAIRNHLKSVKTGVKGSIPVSLVHNGGEYVDAYMQGSDAVINYLAQRFGISLDGDEPAAKFQPDELRLKTWNKEDIKRNLEIAWIFMLSIPIASDAKDLHMKSYYLGIKNTLYFLAYSFGIDKIGPPKDKGFDIEMPPTI